MKFLRILGILVSWKLLFLPRFEVMDDQGVQLPRELWMLVFEMIPTTQYPNIMLVASHWYPKF